MLPLSGFADAVACLSLNTIRLGLQKPRELRRYVSYCSKRFDELTGRGLSLRALPAPQETATITLPAYHSGGGMSFAELVILARVTRTMQPKIIFEMGTYNGLTTAVFMLNATPGAEVITLDLPPTEGVSGKLSSDKDLISSRDLASVPRALSLERYTQLLCDSMQFDPAPYADSVQLGLVDAAHDVLHAQNDTIKMVTMMKNDGLIFWHDYGGKGLLRGLASYLEELAQVAPIFRIPETSLAWAPAGGLKAFMTQGGGIVRDGTMNPTTCGHDNFYAKRAD